MLPELDDRRCGEHAFRVDYQLSVLNGENIALYEQQVRGALDRKETASWNVDAMGVLEVLDCCACRCLKLQIWIVREATEKITKRLPGSRKRRLQWFSD